MADVRPATWKPLMVRGVPRLTVYRESNIDLPGYNVPPRSQKGRLTHRVPWGNNASFALRTHKDYLGYSTVGFSPSGVKFLSRIIPWEHPDCPNYLFAETLTMGGDVPRGQDEVGVGKADEAVITVDFAAFPYEILTDAELAALLPTSGHVDAFPDEAALLRYVSFRYTTAYRYEMQPSLSPLVWTADNPPTPVGTRVPVLMVEGDLRITWHQIPISAVPQTAIRAALGKAVRFPGVLTTGSMIHSYVADLGFADLLMQAPTIGKAYRMVNGEFAVDIEYQFKHYPNGANTRYRWDAEGGGQFQSIAFRNGTLLYPSGNFINLFRPEP